MRHILPPKPQIGDFRIKTRFLLFPKTLPLNSFEKSARERRWLEKASWVQEYKEVLIPCGDIKEGYRTFYTWDNLCWSEESERET